MNKIEELIARKEDAITKTTAKAAELQRTIDRKHRIISEHEAKIAKLLVEIGEKQSSKDEQEAYTDGQREVLHRLEHELEIWNSVDAKILDAQEVFEKFTELIRSKPSVRRDGTKIEGFTYDRVVGELETLRRVKLDAENTAQSIYYGKR